LARNFDFAWLASSARVFSCEYFSARSASSAFEPLQVEHVGAQRCIVLDQLLLVLLDAGDVGADRDVAAVLGAALGDVQPAAVVELGSNVRAPGACAPVSCSLVRTSGMLPTSITVS
jgi:hypothetical protein